MAILIISGYDITLPEKNVYTIHLPTYSALLWEDKTEHFPTYIPTVTVSLINMRIFSSPPPSQDEVGI